MMKFTAVIPEGLTERKAVSYAKTAIQYGNPVSAVDEDGVSAEIRMMHDGPVTKLTLGGVAYVACDGLLVNVQPLVDYLDEVDKHKAFPKPAPPKKRMI